MLRDVFVMKNEAEYIKPNAGIRPKMGSFDSSPTQVFYVYHLSLKDQKLLANVFCIYPGK